MGKELANKSGIEQRYIVTDHNKYGYEKKRAGPEHWNEKALRVEVILAREALPVLSQKSINPLSKIDTGNCIRVWLKN